MQTRSVGTRVTLLVLGTMLGLGIVGEGRAVAQGAEPALESAPAPSPASPNAQSPGAQSPANRSTTREQREIESLRREVAELRELVRRLQENITARDRGRMSTAIDLRWPVAPKAPAARPEILEEPRGHLLFPIQIERANFPSRSPLQRIDDAPPQGGIRAVPERK
jgi:hypothetical protein